MGENNFWQEIRGSLMVRGDGWKVVVEELPSVMSATEAVKLLQTKDQLLASGMSGVGFIAGSPVFASPDTSVLASNLPENGQHDLRSITLQWLYRYFVVESLAEHWRGKPLATWPTAHLDLVTLGLHFMTYMAALMCLIEEGKITTVSDDLTFLSTEAIVRDRLRQTTANLHPKAQDYGESFRRHGLPGILPRLWDKIARYVQLQADNRPSHFEPKADSARDLLGYCAIALSLALEVPEEARVPRAFVEETHG